MTRLFFLLIIVFFYISCSVNEGLIIAEEAELIFPIDSSTLNSSSTIQYFKDGEIEYLGYLNEYQNQIQIYDLNDRTLKFKIPLKHEGKNSVPQIGGFFIVSLDSIILTPYSVPKYYIINENSEIIDILDFEIEESGVQSTSYVVNTRISTPIAFNGDKMYLGQYPLGTWTNMSKLELSKSKICLEYNFTLDSARFLPMGFPLEYLESGATDFFYSKAINNELTIYSFPQDHNIYITSNHENYRISSAKSQYIKEFLPLPDNPYSAPDAITNYLASNPKYTNIAYDPYRNVYYRFVFHGHELKSGENPKQLIRNKKEVSVILLNDKFEILTELMLEEGVYNVDNFFISEKGLYISKSNYFNNQYDENQLIFGLFTIKL